jgi:coenzyme F420-reducing hydrogenase beta subunit
MSPQEPSKKQSENIITQSMEHEDLGIICDLFSAKTAVKGQDGGVVTTLLCKGLREDLFDTAIVIQRGLGYTAEAVIAKSEEEILAAKGTKYLRVEVNRKLRELIAQGKKRIAIVCTPCQVNAARKIMQAIGKNCELTIIGLFCYQSFDYKKLKEELQNRLQINLDTVSSIQISQGKFTVKIGDGEVSSNAKDFCRASEPACSFCEEFTSKLADVSVGSVGSQPGFSTVIVRSELGQNLVRDIDAVKAPVNKEEIIKIAKLKRQRAKKIFNAKNHE